MSAATANDPALAKPIDRTQQVLKWILEGASQFDIEQAIAATWPGAKAKPLIVDAMKHVAKAGDSDPAILRGWAIEATRMIYQKALDVGDLQTALKALDQVVKLSK